MRLSEVEHRGDEKKEKRAARIGEGEVGVLSAPRGKKCGENHLGRLILIDATKLYPHFKFVGTHSAQSTREDVKHGYK